MNSIPSRRATATAPTTTTAGGPHNFLASPEAVYDENNLSALHRIRMVAENVKIGTVNGHDIHKRLAALAQDVQTAHQAENDADRPPETTIWMDWALLPHNGRGGAAAIFDSGLCVSGTVMGIPSSSTRAEI
jgi:hypothetical protein